jgi:hypothetical protein
MKRRVAEMIEFKESAKWSALESEADGQSFGSDAARSSNKFGITAQSMICLAAPLEKCAHLKEVASERRGEQTEARRNLEMQQKARGQAMRQASYEGLINTRGLLRAVNSSAAADTSDEISGSQSSVSSASEGVATERTPQVPQMVQNLAVDPHKKAPRAARNVHGEIMRSPGGGIMRAELGASKNIYMAPAGDSTGSNKDRSFKDWSFKEWNHTRSQY